MKLQKLFVAGLVGVSIFGAGAVAGQNQAGVKPVQASKQVKAQALKLGTTYKRGGLSLRVTDYKTRGQENYVITTNFKKSAYYDIGCNSRHGKTRGVIVAYGPDQR